MSVVKWRLIDNLVQASRGIQPYMPSIWGTKLGANHKGDTQYPVLYVGVQQRRVFSIWVAPAAEHGDGSFLRQL